MKKSVFYFIIIFLVSFFCIGVSKVHAGYDCVYGTDGKELFTLNVNKESIPKIDRIETTLFGLEIIIVSDFGDETFDNGCKDLYFELNKNENIWEFNVSTEAYDASGNAKRKVTLISSTSIPEGTTGFDFCAQKGVLTVFEILGYLLLVVRIVVPLILIIMGSIDLGKAVVGSKDEEIKSSTNALFKRAIAGIAIFFIPTILNLIFGLIDGYEDGENPKSKYHDCWYNIFNPINSVKPSKASGGGGGGGNTQQTD